MKTKINWFFVQFRPILQGWIHPKTVTIYAQRAVALPYRLFSAENTRSLRMLGSKVSLLAFLDISFSLRVELETFRPSVFSPWCWILQDLQPFESFISGQHSMVMLEADSIPLIRIMRSNEVIFRRLINVQYLKYRGFKNYMLIGVGCFASMRANSFDQSSLSQHKLLHLQPHS